MVIEPIPGTTNVVRFPIEERGRPTLDLLRSIAPDAREVTLLAETHEIDLPADPREHADRQAAEYILNQIDNRLGEGRDQALSDMLAELIASAVQACRAARREVALAAEANERLAMAQDAGGYWIDPLKARAAVLGREAAELTIAAYVQTEQIEGAARAVGLARSGQPWTPYDQHAEAEALFFGNRQTA